MRNNHDADLKKHFSNWLRCRNVVKACLDKPVWFASFDTYVANPVLPTDVAPIGVEVSDYARRKMLAALETGTTPGDVAQSFGVPTTLVVQLAARATPRLETKSAKLTADSVREMRAAYELADESPQKLAAQYGISLRNVYAVLRRESWRHIE